MQAKHGDASAADRRAWARGSDFAEIDVDPRNKEIVYTAAIAAYKSTDGGKTFTAFKGAPGGDDYHTLWINPENPDIMLLATDQGAVDQREWRRDVEFLVQPTDRAVLSRHH